MSDYIEKRDFLRMSIDSALEYRITDDKEVYQANIINLSGNGILFKTSHDITPGIQIGVTITPVNDITPPLSADVRVIRCDNLAEDEYHVAAEIINMD